MGMAQEFHESGRSAELLELLTSLFLLPAFIFGLLLSLFSLLPPLFFLFAPLFCLQKQSLVIWGVVVGHRSVRGEVARGNWEGLDRWVP
jgi:hypothetical protein